jgi:hypothetical protein
VWTGDSYLKRPCLGWCVVYGLHPNISLSRRLHSQLMQSHWSSLAPQLGTTLSDVPQLSHFIQSPQQFVMQFVQYPVFFVDLEQPAG